MSEENEQSTSNANAIDPTTLDQIALQYTEQENESGQDETENSDLPQIETKEILLPVVTVATKVLAPNWEIGDEENQMLAESYAAILDKYFPNVGGSFGVEINALIVTGAILMPRLGKPAKLPPPEPSEKELKDLADWQAGKDGESSDSEVIH